MKLLLILLILQSSLMASTPMEDDYSSAESTPIEKQPAFLYIIRTVYTEMVEIGYIDIKIPKGSREYQSAIVNRYKDDMDSFILPSMTDFYVLGVDKEDLTDKMKEEALQCFDSIERSILLRFNSLRTISAEQPETCLRFVFEK